MEPSPARRALTDGSLPDVAHPVATCPVCWKPLANLPAVLRQGDKYVHATCWNGEEPVEKATVETEATAEQTQGGDRAPRRTERLRDHPHDRS